MKLLPVNVVEERAVSNAELQEVIDRRCEAIHIELPGEIRISLEGDVDPAVVRRVLRSLRL
jgi:transposase